MGGMVPALISAGGAIGAALIGKHNSGGGKNSPLAANQSGALTDAMTTARTAGTQGASLFGTGAPLLAQAASYYQRLLGNDVATVNQAVAPQRAALTEAYSGAEKGLEAGPLRGGARDYARADLSRQKVGQIGMLVPNAINQAVPEAGRLGLGAAVAGQAGTQAAGGLYSTLTGQGEGARQFDTEQGYRLGTNIGGFLTNLLSTYYQGRGTTPGSSTTTATTGAPPRVTVPAIPGVGSGGNMVQAYF